MNNLKLDYAKLGIENDILLKYNKKITNVDLLENEKNIFNDFSSILSTDKKILNNQDLTIDTTTQYIDVIDLNRYSDLGLYLLSYLVEKMIKILEINKNKIIKLNLANMLLDFINSRFVKYNKTISYDNIEITKFVIKMKSETFIDNIVRSELNASTDIYGEYKDPNAEKTEEDVDKELDAKEESEAMQVENEEEDFELSREYIRVENDATDYYNKQIEIERGELSI